MDKIILKGMRFYGYHGVFPAENQLGQQFFVDMTMFLDLAQANARDDLTLTVNYAEAYHLVKRLVEGKPFKLIEALAEHIASTLLDTYTIVSEITVGVTKPHPPFDVQFDGVTVEIHRKRDRL
jgi:dihydroneopterin aldolase